MNNDTDYLKLKSPQPHVAGLSHTLTQTLQNYIGYNHIP